eukprot:242999_1
MTLNCRMYEKMHPSKGDLVVVQVKSILSWPNKDDLYCWLLEYGGLPGIILKSQQSDLKYMNLKQILTCSGGQQIVYVLDVKRYLTNSHLYFVTLSKTKASSISFQHMLSFKKHWIKSVTAHGILRHVAKHSIFEIQELYKLFGWSLARKFGHIYDGLKYVLKNESKCLQQFDIPKEIHSILLKNIKKKLSNPVQIGTGTIHSVIECMCFTNDGIIAIKNSFKKALKLSTDEFDVKIKSCSSPKYTLTATKTKYEDIKKMNDIIQVIRKEITNYGGQLQVLSAPQLLLSMPPIATYCDFKKCTYKPTYRDLPSKYHPWECVVCDRRPCRCEYHKLSKGFSVHSKQKQDNLLIYGYIRECTLYIPNEITDYIERYYHYHHKYVDTFISAYPNKCLGRIKKAMASMPPNDMFTFDDTKCLNCGQRDSNGILVFMLSYVDLPKKLMSKYYTCDGKGGFYNTANEYQCKRCKFYTVHNVKKNVKENSRGDEVRKIHFITPFQNDVSDKVIDVTDLANKRKNGICGECGNDSLELEYHSSYDTVSYTHYCVSCATYEKYYSEFI